MADQADDDGNPVGNQANNTPDNAAPAQQSPPSRQAQAEGNAGGNQGNGNANPPIDDLAVPPEPNEDADVLVTEEIRGEVRDALELVNFIVKTGAKKPDGRSVAPELITVIKVTAGKIKLFDESKEPVSIKASAWTRFELAYYALVEFISPVTVETLRNTRNTGKGLIWEASPAQKFTWLLWAFTIGFAVVVIACGVVSTGAENNTPKGWGPNLTAIGYYIPIIAPWTYGGLGACAYLLRTAHNLIAERSFDIRRKPEYLNRILLGMVSGGAIVLLFNPGGEEDTVKISAAALGFVAGYSNDLLFNAIERIMTAILPKVGLDTLKKDSTPATAPLELQTGGMTLKDLMDRMENAKPEDKELYKSLLAKLRDRL
jgi:hypothetical protein